MPGIGLRVRYDEVTPVAVLVIVSAGDVVPETGLRDRYDEVPGVGETAILTSVGVETLGCVGFDEVPVVGESAILISVGVAILGCAGFGCAAMGLILPGSDSASCSLRLFTWSKGTDDVTEGASMPVGPRIAEAKASAAGSDVSVHGCR